MVAVSRSSGLIVGQQVSQDRDVDTLPPAPRYNSDEHAAYLEVVWPEGSQQVISRGKEETHTVESVNANLRTYLKRSRAPLTLFQPLPGGAGPSRAPLCLLLQPAAAPASRASSLTRTFASARLATPIVDV